MKTHNGITLLALFAIPAAGAGAFFFWGPDHVVPFMAIYSSLLAVGLAKMVDLSRDQKNSAPSDALPTG